MTKIKRRHGPILALLAGLLLCLPQNTAASTPPHLGYGMMLAFPPGNLSKVVDAASTGSSTSSAGTRSIPNTMVSMTGSSVDTQLDSWACPNDLNVLLRVERSTTNWTPIQDHEMPGWQAFFQALATRVSQRRAACGKHYRVAFEIWNEPNLDFQWNYQPVDPVRYTEMVRRAYLGTKAGDPTIPVVAGSLRRRAGMAPVR